MSSLVKKRIIDVELEDKCFGECQTEIIINPNFYKVGQDNCFVLTNLKIA